MEIDFKSVPPKAWIILSLAIFLLSVAIGYSFIMGWSKVGTVKKGWSKVGLEEHAVEKEVNKIWKTKK